MTDVTRDRQLRDPTSELSPSMRERLMPTRPLTDVRIGLFSIAKERSNEFMDYMEALLAARNLKAERFVKATHTKIAAQEVIGAMTERCDVVIGGLAD